MDSTAYIPKPLWAKVTQRSLFVAMYALMFVAGAAAWNGLGFPAHEAGAVMMAASVVGVVGVLTGYYHIELIGLPPLIAGLAVCVVWILQPEQNAVLTGYLVAGYIPSLAARLLALNLLASQKRRDNKRGRR